MRRWILFYLFLFSAIALGFFSYLFIHRAEFASIILTKTLKTSVRVDEICLSKRGIQVVNFRISNPEGCMLKKAFSTDRISVMLAWRELLKVITGIGASHIELSEIAIHRPYIGLELFNDSGSDNNWKRLFDTLPPSTVTASSRRFSVEKLIITKIRVQMLRRTASLTTINPPVIARLDITKLGENSPLTAEELLHSTFMLLLDEVASDLKLGAIMQGIKRLPLDITKTTLQAPVEVSKSILNAIDTLRKKITGLFSQDSQEGPTPQK